MIVIVLLILFLLPIVFSVSTNNKVADLNHELKLIRKSFEELNRTLKQERKPYETTIAEIEPVQESLSVENEVIPEVTTTPVIIPEDPVAEIIPDPVEEVTIIINEPILETISEPVEEEIFVPEINHQEKVYVTEQKSDIERFIGEKLLSLVGIGVFVLGIFFLVKWAIDKEMIGNSGKVLIGLLSGTLLIGTAHYIRNNYKAFSSILVGGGLAVYYFTVYIAFQDYDLLNQTTAFIIMVVITTFAVLLSIVYDKKELAVIAIIGGFATPFWVSTGQGNYKVLFSYLLILNIGMFILASFKRWNIVNIISYTFTILIFGAWMAFKFEPRFDETHGQVKGALLFASLFYLTFFGMNLVYNIRNHQKFRPGEIIMLLSNTFLYYSVGMYCLSFIQKGEFQGMFTIFIGVVNFIVVFFLFRKEQVDKNLVYLLIGLVLTFLSLTGPVQLDGNYITLFWALEMSLLLWLGQKSGIKLIKETSLIVLVLTLASLIMDWKDIYNNDGILKIFLNKAFITGAVVTLSFIVTNLLLKNDEEDFWTLAVRDYKKIIRALTLVMVYLVFLLELWTQLNARLGSDNITGTYIVMYHYLFLLIVNLILSQNDRFNLSNTFITLGGIVVAFYLLFNKYTVDLIIDYLEGRVSGGIFYSHYINAVLALILLYVIGKMVVKYAGLRTMISKVFAWFATATAVIILSCEILHIWVVAHYEPGFKMDVIFIKGLKICLPILWGLTSFVIMARGMHQKLKTLRVISLTLFTITLLKLFIYDIANASQGGKIAAFISLGILLLIVSFMYQKLKGMLIDGPNENESE